MDTPIRDTFAPLQVERLQAGISITGGTFGYRFSGSCGLITSVRIRGREWLAGRGHLPDLWVSDAVHPRGAEYTAAHETRAEMELVSAAPDRAVIRARGRYLNGDGAAFPLEYEIEYTIDIDGVVRVDVRNRAVGAGALRWLVFSGGSLPADLVRFVNHSEDLSRVEARTGRFDSQPVPAADGTVLAGRFYPWLQFGNDDGGIDLTVDRADRISYGYTDSMPYYDGLGEAGAACEVRRDRDRVSWEYFSIRNLYTPVRPGWTRENRFYLGVAPAKEWDPKLADLRVNWLGPHQIDPGFVYPSDWELESMARQGINLVLGCAHWRSGEYSAPREPEETERVIRACHRNGMRIIPYITFTDLNHHVPAFQEHGQEWQIEPVAEFRHLTNLMCYGAEGWREYWKREVDAALDRFDFDGLYIDFWVGKMACTNPLHGCGLRYGRYTLPGLREMAMHAFRRVRERGGFILSNTNMCAGTLINNLVDIRLPGEWGNIEETADSVVRGYLNSRRLGCNALILAERVPRYTLRSVSLALRCQSSITGWRGRKPAERKLYMRYADILRSFGVGKARSLGAWESDGSLSATPRKMVTYWYRNDRGALIVGVDTGGKAGKRCVRVERPERLGLRPGKGYLLYRPDAGCLLTGKPVEFSKGRSLSAELEAWEPLLVFAARAKDRPQVLWATFSDGIEDEHWNGGKRRLSLRVKGVEGAKTEVTVYAAGRRVEAVLRANRPVRYRLEGELLTFTSRCNEEVVIEFA